MNSCPERDFPKQGFYFKTIYANGREFLVGYDYSCEESRSNLLNSTNSIIFDLDGKPYMFQEISTSQSILAIARGEYDRQINDFGFGNWIRFGRGVKSREGVFANPPIDSEGRVVCDEKTLQNLLGNCIKCGEVYLGENSFGFAPYDSFTQGIQDLDRFVNEGFAKILEHCRGPAKNFTSFATSTFLGKGGEVEIFDFEPCEKPMPFEFYMGNDFDYCIYRNIISPRRLWNFAGIMGFFKPIN